MVTKGILLGSSILMTAGMAHAQNAAPPTPSPSPGTASASASTTSPGLNEIVVTAQRRAEKLQNVPLTVNEVSASQLSKAGVTSVRDLGNLVAGFTFGGQGTVSQPAIRGVTTQISSAGSENANALYVDGVYQATQAALSSSLPDVERIEVLKGPQGTLFGRNATGGAIQIFTKGPSFTPKADIDIDTSYYTGSGSSHSSPRVNVRAFVAGPIIPDLVAASFSAGYDYTRGFYTNDATGEQDGLIRHANLRGKLLVTPAPNAKITLSAYYIKNNDEGNLLATPFEGLTAAAGYPGTVIPSQPYHAAYDATPGGGDFNIASLKQYGYSAKIELDFDIGTLTSLSAYNNTKTLNHNSIANARATIPCLANFACIDYDFAVKNREISQEFNFASRHFGPFSFVAGLYYYDAKGSTLGIVQETLIPGGIPAQLTDFHTTAYAGYAEGTLALADGLTFVAGIRQSHEPHNDQSFVPASPALHATFNSTTPRASLRYALTSNLNIYGTFSIGYKSGLTGATNVASVPQFAPVKPEKIYAYEAGAKYATHDITLNGAFFYYDYRNKQEQTFLGTSSVIKNTGPVEIYGFDFDGQAHLTRNLDLRGTLSWIPVAKYKDFPDASGQSTLTIPFDPTMPPFACAPGGGCGGFYPGSGTTIGTFDASGSRLPRTPKITASGTLAYQQDVGNGGKFDTSATLTYSSAVVEEITATIVQKAYVSLNAQAGYLFAGGLRVGVFGRNLTNKAYIVNALTSSAGFVVGYTPPREIGLSIHYSF